MSSAEPISGATASSFFTLPKPAILGMPMDFEISVAMPPGAMQLQRMPLSRYWKVVLRETAHTAALEAA
jgi:hypothetical protein